MVAKQKRGLGKGLNELLASSVDTVLQPEPVRAEEQKADGDLSYIPVEQISKSPYQPRTEIDPNTLDELANSIKAQGLLQPVVVREIEKNRRYQLVAGERRWRASQLAGLEKIPALVRNISDSSALAMGIIENIQRENLNAIDTAKSVARLIEEFDLTQLEVSEAIGKSRSSITNLLRLLKLNPDVKILLERGDIEVGHAKALLALSGKAQSEVAKTIVMRGLSVRDTESLISNLSNRKAQSKEIPPVDPNVLRLQQDLADKLGAKVTIKCSKKGKGYLVINYNNLDELDGILAHIN